MRLKIDIYIVVVLMYAGAWACSNEHQHLKSCTPTCGDGPFYAISEIILVTASADGIAQGFNVDGLISDGQDRRDCHTADLTSPEGERGIDNKLASVLAFLGEDALSTINNRFQQAINTGGFLFTVEQIKRRGQRSDLVFRRGAGTPLLDDQQRLQAGQTIGLHADPFYGAVENVEEINGRATSPPFKLSLRFDVEDRPIQLTLLNCRFRYERNKSDQIAGILGGIVEIEDSINFILGLLNRGEADRQRLEIIMPALADVFDPESGKCNHFSLAVAYRAVPIYITGTDHAP